jgi:hypothetical protein
MATPKPVLHSVLKALDVKLKHERVQASVAPLAPGSDDAIDLQHDTDGGRIAVTADIPDANEQLPGTSTENCGGWWWSGWA